MEKSRAIELLEHLAWDRDIERNPYGDALNMAIEALKAQLSQEGTTSDLISRQAAIDALAEQMPTPYTPDGSHPADEQIFQVQEVYVDCITTLELLPTIQTEPAIPLSWIEKHIEWHKSLDSEFANLAAAHISVMVKKWRDEQNETD